MANARPADGPPPRDEAFEEEMEALEAKMELHDALSQLADGPPLSTEAHCTCPPDSDYAATGCPVHKQYHGQEQYHGQAPAAPPCVHVCGLQGYDQMRDGRCPGCVARADGPPPDAPSDAVARLYDGWFRDAAADMQAGKEPEDLVDWLTCARKSLAALVHRLRVRGPAPQEDEK